MRPTVVIDCFPERARNYVDGYAIVAVDVIRATTTAVTAAVQGRRCFPVASLDEAHRLRDELGDALLMGELGGDQVAGFDLTNSPAALARRHDVARPVVLLSTSGTRLIEAARDCEATYLACLRNAAAVAQHVAGLHARVAVIGAGSRGEFRREDQVCCAWVAAGLLAAGYESEDDRTAALVARWRDAPASACTSGKSADYLRRTGQLEDLAFVVGHVDDVHVACAVEAGEVVMLPPDRAPDRAASAR